MPNIPDPKLPWFREYHQSLTKNFGYHDAKNIALGCTRCRDGKDILNTYNHNGIEGKAFLWISLKELCFEQPTDENLSAEALKKKLECILERRITHNSHRNRHNRITLFLLLILGVFISPLCSLLRTVGFPDSTITLLTSTLNVVWVITALSLIALFLPTGRVLARFSFKNAPLEGSLSSDNASFGTNAFHLQLAKDLVSIADHYHRTVVFEDMDTLSPKVRTSLLLTLKSLNDSANEQGWKKFRRLAPLRAHILHHLIGKKIDFQPIRFLYLIPNETPPKPFQKIFIPAAVNAKNAKQYLKHSLQKITAIASPELSHVCELIANTVTDQDKLDAIVACFNQWKPVCEGNLHRKLPNPERAKLLALAAYQELDPDGFRIFNTEAATQTLPVSEYPKVSRQVTQLLLQLHHYLDADFLRYLSQTDSSADYDLETLISGSSDNKRRILESRLYSMKNGQDPNILRNQILNKQLHLLEPDPDIALLYAQYLDLSAHDCLNSLLVCLSHQGDVFYNLYHPACCLNAMKLSMDQDPCLITAKHLHGEFYFKNTLLALRRFSDDELFDAVALIDHDKLMHHLQLWTDLYYYSAYHLMHSNDKRWDAHWDVCIQVLLICMNNDAQSIPKSMKRKRFGRKKLQDYLKCR